MLDSPATDRVQFLSETCDSLSLLAKRQKEEIDRLRQTGVMGNALAELCRDAAEWSQETFGTDRERGPIGPLKHLEKEAREVQASPNDPNEYADCFLLILDAARRAGIGPLSLIHASQDKLRINKTRTYPKPMVDEASEHIRGTNEG